MKAPWHGRLAYPRIAGIGLIHLDTWAELCLILSMVPVAIDYAQFDHSKSFFLAVFIAASATAFFQVSPGGPT